MNKGTVWPRCAVAAVLLTGLLAACSGSSGEEGGGADSSTTVPTKQTLEVGAASRSILPTVNQDREYLIAAPGWPPSSGAGPTNPGVFVAKWDQGQVDVGNGAGDSAWVHDDLTATAVVIERGDQRAIIVSTDTYMHFAPDADEIERRVHNALTEEWAEVPVLVAATHNHHGPDTAFSVNPDWYEMAAGQIEAAVVEAVGKLAPATVSVNSGEHSYGVADGRDPIILDPSLNVMSFDSISDGEPIATVVQWASHPETTLGWNPTVPEAELQAACTAKGWEGDDCTAEGRYFTADYPGVLRARLQEDRSGEVLYLNGAIGNQIGPGDAPTWVVDEEHPVTPDGSVPAGAQPLTACGDEDPYLCQSFAKTESIGEELATASLALLAEAEPLEVSELTVESEAFFTRMTNIGFRVLIADESIGWQDPELFTCDGKPSEDSCEEAPLESEDDPVITPLADSQVTVGDVVRSRVTRLDMGSVGFMFLPGELPPELVIGLPEDFETNPDAYYRQPELHAVGAEYRIPGALLSLPEEDLTFTVGLGTDELGYFVPVDDYRLRCIDLALPDGATCADLADRGVIDSPDFIAGATCVEITNDPEPLEALGADGDAVAAICRYGQALGRELGEPEGHYEETNAVGWDVVEDLWAAAQQLYGA